MIIFTEAKHMALLWLEVNNLTFLLKKKKKKVYYLINFP